MRHYLIPVYLSPALILGAQAYGQISDYNECSEVFYDASKSSRPLTQEEQVAFKDQEFYELLTDINKCSSDNAASASGNGAGRPNASSSVNSGSLSKNQLGKGDQSISIANSATQSPEGQRSASTSSEEAPSQYDNGRKELALEKVDNRAALRAQIKAQIDIEADPEIKRQLTEQYEALK
jgi:hypothetical protein